jgi:hypothetical protein
MEMASRNRSYVRTLYRAFVGLAALWCSVSTFELMVNLEEAGKHGFGATCMDALDGCVAATACERMGMVVLDHAPNSCQCYEYSERTMRGSTEVIVTARCDGTPRIDIRARDGMNFSGLCFGCIEREVSTMCANYGAWMIE